MRRSMILPMAALLVLGVAAPVSAGANVSNTSGGGNSVYGEWFDEGTFGYAYLWQENGQPGYGEIYQESGEWVLCPAAEPTSQTTAIGPTDTGGEEFYGFQGTRTFGWAYDVQISLSRRLDTGNVTGPVDLWTVIVDECAGTYDETYESADLSIALTGTGELVMFRGMGSYQVPSQFNGHYNYRGKERQATGSIVAGSISADFDFAFMSQLTWSEHVNS